MDQQLRVRNVVFGRDEVGFSMSYSFIRFIVDKCKGVHLNDTDAYHFFVLISTSNAQKKENGALKQNFLMKIFRNTAVKIAIYHACKTSWAVYDEWRSINGGSGSTLTSDPWWLEEEEDSMRPYLTKWRLGGWFYAMWQCQHRWKRWKLIGRGKEEITALEDSELIFISSEGQLQRCWKVEGRNQDIESMKTFCSYCNHDMVHPSPLQMAVSFDSAEARPHNSNCNILTFLKWFPTDSLRQMTGRATKPLRNRRGGCTTTLRNLVQSYSCFHLIKLLLSRSTGMHRANPIRMCDGRHVEKFCWLTRSFTYWGVCLDYIAFSRSAPSWSLKNIRWFPFTTLQHICKRLLRYSVWSKSRRAYTVNLFTWSERTPMKRNRCSKSINV